jgi:hypothetical protein
MECDPALLSLADRLRAKFGARLIWLKTQTVEVGKPVPQEGRELP